MVQVCFLHPNGDKESVASPEGLSLMEVALNNGIPEIVADCGGVLSCATCHVYIEGEWFDRSGEVSAAETELLEFAIDRQPNSRLSCQVVLNSALDGIVVCLPEKQQ